MSFHPAFRAVVHAVLPAIDATGTSFLRSSAADQEKRGERDSDESYSVHSDLEVGFVSYWQG
jgi:hypothetical protein